MTNKKNKNLLILLVVIVVVVIGIWYFSKAPLECISGQDKCVGSSYYICQNENWINQGEIAGKCGVAEDPLKETYYKLANNMCSAISIYPSEKTVNDYLTLVECQSNVISLFTIILQEPNTENFGDTEVTTYNRDRSFGVSKLLVVGYSSYGEKYRTYLKFDISSLPPGSTINTATLYLWQDHLFAPDRDFNIGVYHVYEDSWIEGENADAQSWPILTWNSQPCGINFDKSLQCNLVESDRAKTGTTEQWLSWDITAIINKEYVDGDNKVSVVLKYIDGREVTSLASKETTTPSERPYLKITYTT